jgi:serine/threonine protein kinase
MSTSYFFEDLENSNTAANLWNIPRENPAGKVIHSGYLLKHSLNAETEDGLSKRYFTLQEDYLVYRQSDDAERVSSAMKVKYAKLVLPKAGESEGYPTEARMSKFILKICFKNKFTLLYATSQVDYDAWIAALTKVMTRSDVHDRFHVEKPIGAGAFAQVLKAREKLTGVYYAIKGFNKSNVLQSESGREALWNEIEMLRKVQGKSNVIALHEVHETKNSIYLVMDYVEGGDLSEFISKNKKIPEAVIRIIVCGILKGLEGLEKESIYHRDLKPANIMLKQTNNIIPEDVVIVDFGLAATSYDTNPIFKRCGTPGYIAPEVISMKNDNKLFQIPSKCDIYSTGVIMHMLCTGTSLFDKTEYDGNTILKKNLMSKIDFPSQVFSKLSEKCNLVVKGLIQTEPSQRLTLRQAINLMTSGSKLKDLNASTSMIQEYCAKINGFVLKPQFNSNPQFINVLDVIIESDKEKDVHHINLGDKLPLIFTKQTTSIFISPKMNKFTANNSSATTDNTPQSKLKFIPSDRNDKFSDLTTKFKPRQYLFDQSMASRIDNMNDLSSIKEQ